MVPETLPDVAVIVVSPVAIALTNPDDEIVATVVLLEVHVTLVVTVPVEPSEKVAVAVNCCEVPADIAVFCGLMAMLVIVLLLTVRPVVAITLPDWALIVVVPKAVPAVARPVLLIDAMLVEEELHVTWLVASPCVLLPNVAVALNCWVAPGWIVVLRGDMVREVI